MTEEEIARKLYRDLSRQLYDWATGERKGSFQGLARELGISADGMFTRLKNGHLPDGITMYKLLERAGWLADGIEFV